MGHSLGGAIASFFTAVFPELVSKLVVLEGIGLWPRENAEAGIAQQIRDWAEITGELAGREPRRYPDLQTAYQRMQVANPRLSEDQAFHLTLHGAVQLEDGQFTWKYDQYTYNFHGVGLSEDEIIALWQNISVPTLLINADQGLQNRTGQDDTLRHFRRADLHNVTAAGHWIHHDQPEAITALIAEFLGRRIPGSTVSQLGVFVLCFLSLVGSGLLQQERLDILPGSSKLHTIGFSLQLKVIHRVVVFPQQITDPVAVITLMRNACWIFCVNSVTRTPPSSRLMPVQHGTFVVGLQISLWQFGGSILS